MEIRDDEPKSTEVEPSTGPIITVWDDWGKVATWQPDKEKQDDLFIDLT